MDKLYTHMLFIGSSNTTGDLHLERVEKIVSRRHDGFTVHLATGHWKGKRENCAVVILNATVSIVTETIQELKDELEQQAVGWMLAGAMQFA